MNNDKVEVIADRITAAIVGAERFIEALDLSELPPDVQRQVGELISLTDRAKAIQAEVKMLTVDLKKELKKVETKAKQLDKDLAPVIKEMVDQLVSAGEMMVKYKPKESQRPAYKKALEYALGKLNADTRRVCEEMAEGTRKVRQWLEVSHVSSDGSRTAGMLGWLKTLGKWFGGLVKVFRRGLGVISKDVDDLEKALKD